MRNLVSLLLIAACGAAQVRTPAKPPAAKPTPPAAKPKPPAAKPQAAGVLATVNGRPVTAASLKSLLIGAPAVALTSARANPQEFLEWNGLMERLSAQAEKEGLDKGSPYLDRLDWSRMQILRTAAFEERTKQFAVTEAEVQKAFEENPLPYATMETKILFIAERPGELEAAKARLDRAMADLAAGKTFAQVVEQHSDYKKDGSFPAIYPESVLPVALRLSIYRTKPGQVTAPFHIGGQGHYLFQVVNTSLKPMEEIRKDLRASRAEGKMRQWLEEMRIKSSVVLINQKFFASLSNLLGAETAQPLAGSGEITPETPLATINGKLMTAKDYTNLMKNIPPGVRANAVQQPQDFLVQYSLLRVIADQAVAEGFDKKQPWAGRIKYDRMQILMQGYVDQYMNGIRIMPDEQKKVYDANAGRYSFAKVKVLQVAYSLTPPPNPDPTAPKVLNEQEAKARAEEIIKELRGGGGFIDLVRRFSDDADSRSRDGDGPTVTAADPNIPEAIKTPVLAAKKGDIVGPIRLPNGFYILRIEESSKKTYDEVKDQVYDEIRQDRFNAWFQTQKKALNVKVVNAPAFQRVVAESGS
ncbi:MAG: hypothetical protein FJW39_25705 [Acidobacteria bacterium]|nr:hypothetical protein [Acidobacteriota bacterium]